MSYDLWDHTDDGPVWIGSFVDQRRALQHVTQALTDQRDHAVWRWQLRRGTMAGQTITVAEGDTLIRLARVAAHLVG